MVQLPADAYTVSPDGGPVAAPALYYDRNLPNGQHNGTLSMYYNAMHWGGTTATRYRVEMDAGSGLNSNNDCITNQGPTPDGLYGHGDNDSLSRLTFMNKTWGSEVVQGYVWYLGGKRCNGPGTTKRTALFIHSQTDDPDTWHDGNYRSRGCVKINQDDRTFLADAYRTAYNSGQALLEVI